MQCRLFWQLALQTQYWRFCCLESRFMADRFSPEKRSQIMSRVKGRNTSPERTVRSWLHRLGYRFRLHHKKLPGHPDIVLPKYRAVIFVHGCFWHGHQGCSRSKRPATNREFWDKKIDATIQRDREVQQRLHAMNWRVLVIWQCEIKNGDMITARLRDFIEGNNYGCS